MATLWAASFRYFRRGFVVNLIQCSVFWNYEANAAVLFHTHVLLRMGFDSFVRACLLEQQRQSSRVLAERFRLRHVIAAFLSAWASRVRHRSVLKERKMAVENRVFHRQCLHVWRGWQDWILGHPCDITSFSCRGVGPNDPQAKQTESKTGTGTQKQRGTETEKDTGRSDTDKREEIRDGKDGEGRREGRKEAI